MPFRANVFDCDVETRTDTERNASEFNGIKKEESNVDDGTPETLESFLSNTTLHGAQYLFAKGTVRRLLWSLALLASLAFCNYQAYESLRQYFQRPFNTKITSKSAQDGGLTFPSVTLCNFNPANMNKIRNFLSSPDLSREEFQKRVDEISKILMQSSDAITDEYKERYPILYNRDQVEALMKANGHQIEEVLLPNVPPMFISCSYAGLLCGAQNFSSFVSTHFGQCFIFKTEQNGNFPLKATMAGKDNGLELRLNIQRNGYINNSKNPFAGIVVLVHDRDNYPFMNERSLSVQPGTHTSFSIKMKKV